IFDEDANLRTDFSDLLSSSMTSTQWRSLPIQLVWKVPQSPRRDESRAVASTPCSPRFPEIPVSTFVHHPTGWIAKLLSNRTWPVASRFSRGTLPHFVLPMT